MYSTPHFSETRPERLHALMAAHPLATLVTVRDGEPVADHIPLEFDATATPCGVLRGHVARGNPVWRDRVAAIPALAIFHGPDTYVSPGWYPSKAQDPRVVPTWNYAVVHAIGSLRFIEDAEWLHGLVTRLTTAHESARTEPWKVTDAPDDYVARMLRGIVGFELAIERLEGKWKMSQNRDAADRQGVAARLRALATPPATDAAGWIAVDRVDE